MSNRDLEPINLFVQVFQGIGCSLLLLIAILAINVLSACLLHHLADVVLADMAYLVARVADCLKHLIAQEDLIA